MSKVERLLQIVPCSPNRNGGVSDYSRLLAQRLEELHRITSTFILPALEETVSTVNGFEVLSPLRSIVRTIEPPAVFLLHYVNYGYGSRGVPLWLPRVLRRLEQRKGCRLVTIFHELYSAGSWRRSAFWLCPLQKRIARELARLSSVSVVSNEPQGKQLAQLMPSAKILLQPVPSNFGEPALTPDELRARSPHCWIISGGTALIKRSLDSFAEKSRFIPDRYLPRELVIVGGRESDHVRDKLRTLPHLKIHYYPEVEKNVAAAVFSTCTFGWLDYFHEPSTELSAILKSGIFGAFCAHGIIPVFPHGGSPIRFRDDILPGPFFLDEHAANLPSESERLRVAQSLHEWYQRSASSRCLGETIAAAIQNCT